jgi:hypothetical protein
MNIQGLHATSADLRVRRVRETRFQPLRCLRLRDLSHLSIAVLQTEYEERERVRAAQRAKVGRLWAVMETAGLVDECGRPTLA